MKTQDVVLGQNKATMVAKVVERLDLRAPARPRFGYQNRAWHVAGLGGGGMRRKRGHRQKRRSGLAHTTQQKGRARAGHFGELAGDPRDATVTSD